MVVEIWTSTLKEMGSHRRILDRGVLHNLHLERCINKRIDGLKGRKLVAVLVKMVVAYTKMVAV